MSTRKIRIKVTTSYTLIFYLNVSFWLKLTFLYGIIHINKNQPKFSIELVNFFNDSKGDPTAGFFEEWKKETEAISARNKNEFSDLPEEQRIDYEGFRAGMYVRVEIDNFPTEFINNMEIKYPIIIGGLLPSEQQRGTLQLRIKRHRWFTRPVLKEGFLSSTFEVLKSCSLTWT